MKIEDIIKASELYHQVQAINMQIADLADDNVRVVIWCKDIKLMTIGTNGEHSLAPLAKEFIDAIITLNKAKAEKIKAQIEAM